MWNPDSLFERVVRRSLLSLLGEDGSVRWEGERVSLFRRRRVPWYAHPIMVLGVLYGLIQSERLVPVITRVMDLEWWYNRINELRRRFANPF